MAIITGTSGNDTLQGMGAADLIVGDGGSDSIFGGGGGDIIFLTGGKPSAREATITSPARQAGPG